MTTIETITRTWHRDLRVALAANAAAQKVALPMVSLHPLDYRLLERAIAINGYDIAEFVRLAVYQASVRVIEGS